MARPTARARAMEMNFMVVVDSSVGSRIVKLSAGGSCKFMESGRNVVGEVTLT